MKKFCLLIALVFCVMFVGCGQSVDIPSEAITLVLAVNQDGSVLQEFDFSVGSQNLSSAGASSEEISSFVKLLSNEITTYRNEFYISFLIAAALQNNSDFVFGQDIVVSDVSFYQEQDVLSFSIYFSSIASYRYYHNLQDEEQGTTEDAQTNIFYSVTTSQFTLPFAAEVTLSSGEVTTVGERYLSMYKTVAGECFSAEALQSLSAPALIFDYAICSSQLKSNAEYIVRSSGLFHHLFIRSEDDFAEDCIINLSFSEIGRGYWYLVVILATVGALGVTILVLTIKEKNKKNLKKFL